MCKVIKKADIILFVILIVFGLTLSWLSVRGAVTGRTVVIRVGGEEYGTYALEKDQTVTVEQDGRTNVIVIQDGTVHMASSTCKNQICVEHAPITKTNESILCLPNQVSIEITGGEDGEIDVWS